MIIMPAPPGKAQPHTLHVTHVCFTKEDNAHHFESKRGGRGQINRQTEWYLAFRMSRVPVSAITNTEQSSQNACFCSVHLCTARTERSSAQLAVVFAARSRCKGCRRRSGRCSRACRGGSRIGRFDGWEAFEQRWAFEQCRRHRRRLERGRRCRRCRGWGRFVFGAEWDEITHIHLHTSHHSTAHSANHQSDTQSAAQNKSMTTGNKRQTFLDSGVNSTAHDAPPHFKHAL